MFTRKVKLTYFPLFTSVILSLGAFAFPLAVKAEVLITEIYPSPVSGQEWIEVFSTSEGISWSEGDWQLTIDEQTVPFELMNLPSHLELGLSETDESGDFFVLAVPENSLADCQQPSDCQVSISLANSVSTEPTMEHPVLKTSYADTIRGYSLALDEDGNWQLGWQPTPGLRNQAASTDTSLRIVEVYPSPNSGEEEWLQIQNKGESEILLWNWQITDGNKSYTLETTVLQPQQTLKIFPTKVSLNNSGDRLELQNFAAEPVDVFEYGSTPKGDSWLRLTDDSIGLRSELEEQQKKQEEEEKREQEKPEEKTEGETEKESTPEDSSDGQEPAAKIVSTLVPLSYAKPQLNFPQSYPTSYAQKEPATTITSPGFVWRLGTTLGLATLSLGEVYRPLKRGIIGIYRWWQG